MKIVDFFIRCSFHKLLFSLYYIPFPIMRYMMVKWKSNAISGFKVSFFRQNAKEFCSCQKISKANNWISFLGKYEIDDDKKGGFFFHILLDRRGSMQKNILYVYCIAIEIKKWDLLTKYFFYFYNRKNSIFARNWSLKVNINRFWLIFFAKCTWIY